PYSGGGSAREEISPTESFSVLERWSFPAGAPLLGHVCSSLKSDSGQRSRRSMTTGCPAMNLRARCYEVQSPACSWRGAPGGRPSSAYSGRATTRVAPTAGGKALPNLDLHQLRWRTIGRDPHGRARGGGIHFQIAHLVVRRRHVLRRLPGVHVD